MVLGSCTVYLEGWWLVFWIVLSVVITVVFLAVWHYYNKEQDEKLKDAGKPENKADCYNWYKDDPIALEECMDSLVRTSRNTDERLKKKKPIFA